MLSAEFPKGTQTKTINEKRTETKIQKYKNTKKKQEKNNNKQTKLRETKTKTNLPFLTRREGANFGHQRLPACLVVHSRIDEVVVVVVFVVVVDFRLDPEGGVIQRL